MHTLYSSESGAIELRFSNEEATKMKQKMKQKMNDDVLKTDILKSMNARANTSIHYYQRRDVLCATLP